MKKILLSLGVVLASIAANAQVDTLTEFFTGTPTIYGAQGGGYVSGSNSYEDIAKGMRFNNANGLANGGSISNVLLWAPIKSDNGGSFIVKIHEFATATTLGPVLGSVTIPLSSVDTALATGYAMAGGLPYNVNATFSTPVTIPASKDVLVMVYLPTTAGDTIALVSNTSGDWANAATHTFEIWSDNSLNDFATAWQGGVNVALAIFPVVNFVLGVDENAITASVYPNPANDVLNINLSANATSVSIIGMDGKVISTEAINANTAAVNVSNLVAGVYFYEIVAENGTVVRNTFVKK
jgi:hypothetical protein